MFKLKFFNFLILINFLNYVSSELNMTEYNRMPKIYALDDYDKCLEEYPNVQSTYCFVDMTIKPNATSPLYQYIYKVSQDIKHYFRHDRLRRGICINWCENLLSQYENETLDEYFEPIFERNISYITFQPENFRKALDYRQKYGRLVNQCINMKLKTKYGLTAYSEIEYCETNQDPFEVDALDIAFVLVLLGLAGTIGLASLYDYYLKKSSPHTKDEEHYKVAPDGLTKLLIISFSMKRNWYKLIAPNQPDEIKPLHTVRFFLECFLIVVHTLFVFNIFPSDNPQFMEGYYQRFASVFITNGLLVIQTYFLVNGFLLAYQFYQYSDKNIKFDRIYFIRKLLSKWFAVVPVYAFVILLHSTWLSLIQDGPLANHFNEPERSFCRQNWWTNLLFINSYYKFYQPCVQQGWFIGSDFILYTIALLCLTIVWKYPKTLKTLLFIGIAYSFLAPAIITYVNEYEGIIMLYLESQKYILWYNPYYRDIYMPSHNNVGSYLIGMIGGWICFYVKREEIEIKKYKWFGIVWWGVLPVAFATLISGYIFYWDDFAKPAIWISIYASISRNLWGIAIAGFVIGAASGIGWIVRNFVNYKIFAPLGRVSLSVYLIHTFVLRVTIGNLRQPNFLSEINITVAVASTIILSYALAILMWLSIETPFSTVQQLIFDKKKDSDDMENNSSSVENVKTINVVEMGANNFG